MLLLIYNIFFFFFNYQTYFFNLKFKNTKSNISYNGTRHLSSISQFITVIIVHRVWCMVGKSEEKLDSGISSIAKCGGCKATGRIIIGSKFKKQSASKKYGISFLVSIKIFFLFIKNPYI